MKAFCATCAGFGMKVWWFLGLAMVAGALAAEASPCTLAWDENRETNLAGYRVYHSYSSNGYTAGGFSFTTRATAITCEEMKIGYDGRLHFWTVTAYDTSGNESPFPAEVWMQMPLVTAPTPPSAPPPPAPTCLQFAGKSGNCKQWDQ
jgi:hypothetical protein